MKNKILVILLLVVFFSLSYSYSLAEENLKCTLFLIEKNWHERDGGNSIIVNFAIVELLVLKPKETLEWLNTKKDIFQYLLENLQIVFTDYTGKDSKKLICLKDSLHNSLLSINSRNNSIESLKAKMLEELKKIRIRKID